MKQKAPRAGRHPARRVALQTLFEIDFNRADAKETWQRGSFRTGLADEAANFAWQLVEGVLEHRRALDEEIHQLAPEFPIEDGAVDRTCCGSRSTSAVGDAPHAAAIIDEQSSSRRVRREAAPKARNRVLRDGGGGRKEPRLATVSGSGMRLVTLRRGLERPRDDFRVRRQLHRRGKVPQSVGDRARVGSRRAVPNVMSTCAQVVVVRKWAIFRCGYAHMTALSREFAAPVDDARNG